MYGQHAEDITEWLTTVKWASSPVVSARTLSEVMRTLVDAAVLEEGELLPPETLVSHLTRDGDPHADAV